MFEIMNEKFDINNTIVFETKTSKMIMSGIIDICFIAIFVAIALHAGDYITWPAWFLAIGGYYYLHPILKAFIKGFSITISPNGLHINDQFIKWADIINIQSIGAAYVIFDVATIRITYHTQQDNGKGKKQVIMIPPQILNKNNDYIELCISEYHQQYTARHSS